MTDLTRTSAVALRRMIGAKQLSPVELLDACLARIAEVNGAVNAVVAIDEDGARKVAKAAEAAVMKGEGLCRLHGLPIGIKDLSATKGLRTTRGSPIFADHVPDKDEGLVARLRDNGGVITAKTNTPEFGAGANTTNAVYGPTRNPFDTARICGGSSGGSGVALATGMLPLCHGSDMGGSLRIPAAYSGVVGFRNTPGVVPSETKQQPWSPLGVQGAMARSVDDCAFMLGAMVGPDTRDPLNRDEDPDGFWPVPPADLSELRIAVSADLGFAPVEKAVRETFATAVAPLEKLVAVFDWQEPPLADADDTFELVRALSFLSSHADNFARHRDKLGPNVMANVEYGMTLSAADVARGLAQQSALYQRFLAFMAGYDVLITPTVGVVPFPVETLYLKEIEGKPTNSYIHWLACTYGITLTAHPAISIPAGLDPTGTPFGLQVVGQYGDDATLLRIAKALEQALPPRPAPDIAALAKIKHN
jgi:Asp-tRNA(Asn)/Glu-tRNA(Gln) amidotransferase A subunit family amidase